MLVKASHMAKSIVKGQGTLYLQRELQSHRAGVMDAEKAEDFRPLR